jgi:hypothetical protein
MSVDMVFSSWFEMRKKREERRGKKRTHDALLDRSFGFERRKRGAEGELGEGNLWLVVALLLRLLLLGENIRGEHVGRVDLR